MGFFHVLDFEPCAKITEIDELVQFETVKGLCFFSEKLWLKLKICTDVVIEKLDDVTHCVVVS